MRRAATLDKLTGRTRMLALAADDYTDERILECLDRALRDRLIVMIVDTDRDVIIQFNSTDEEIPP